MLIKTASRIFIAITLLILVGGFIAFKNKGDTALTVLLKASSISPLNPQLSTEDDSLCREKSSGIPIQIQSQNIIPVYKRDGSKQCEEAKGISVEKMAEELKKTGIKVFKSVKGRLVDARGPSVCGDPTSNINIFYILSKRKSQVLEKGFQSCIDKNTKKN